MPVATAARGSAASAASRPTRRRGTAGPGRPSSRSRPSAWSGWCPRASRLGSVGDRAGESGHLGDGGSDTGSRVSVWPGRPFPLGATWDGEGTNFSVFSEHAERVELCLFDDDDAETRVELTQRIAFNWHGYVPGV